MRLCILLLSLLAATAQAVAVDLGAMAPGKPVTQTLPPPPDPDVLRQGGDTFATAVEIHLPYSGLGTTAGHNDDYDEVCPYGGSTSPDVVYTFQATATTSTTIDLQGSSYDTKVYVYDADLNLIGCNDDYYADNTSLLAIDVQVGVVYYVIIDGYGGDFGEYRLNIPSVPPTFLECPAGAQVEGEPPLVDDYVDVFNSGCQSGVDGPFQRIDAPVFCGVNGWYTVNGSWYRDDDYYDVIMPAAGVLEIIADAEIATYLVQWSPPDCITGFMVQVVQFGGLAPASMVITGQPGEVIWLYVGATVFTPPPGYDQNEYDFVLRLNLEPVALRDHSWSEVKSLFR